MRAEERFEIPGGADLDQERRAVDLDVQAACARIAPTWPLDAFIAVNPFWPQTDIDLAAVSARVGAHTEASLAMPLAWFRAAWRAGRFGPEQLRRALEESAPVATPGALQALLDGSESITTELPRRLLRTDVADAGRDLRRQPSWRSFVLQQLSQHCAGYFDGGEADWRGDRALGLYAGWRKRQLEDLAPRLLMGFARHRTLVRELPETAAELVPAALAALEVEAGARVDYLHGLLLSINGWASWCAWLRWQARLDGGDDQHIVDLLAMRLAWEWLLHRAGTAEQDAHWRTAVAAWPAVEPARREAERMRFVMLSALEHAYDEQMVAVLQPVRPLPARATRPPVQAVFCIDVRSEAYRLALETVAPELQTLGFAGFFGLPIEYLPLAGRTPRPQLPGLLAPALRAVDVARESGLETRRRQRLGIGHAFKQLRSAATSGFAYVETLGLTYATKLIGDERGATRPVGHPEHVGLDEVERAAIAPQLARRGDGAPLGRDEQVALAASVLRALGLLSGHARLVLLVGHGAETVNNPHAGGLDCGACGGQTGEVNARVLAGLLNDVEVRAGLAEQGISIPSDTHFLAGLHNTTTDEVVLYDLDASPPSLAGEIGQLRDALAAAGARVRRVRSATLGLVGLDDAALLAALRARGRDWAETRPEWGLADNAAFIVAPRARTRGIDLGGRAFLHDYDAAQDPDFSVLELIMTAPMVVTHWINMQYYASTVAQELYGSGNKTLHNVVGGHLGVFEGNSGDLRIGLPLQSLHDGARWMHTPQRLAVYIEAPRAAIDDILARHEAVYRLVEHGWLRLHAIEPAAGTIARRTGRGWQELGPSPG